MIIDSIRKYMLKCPHLSEFAKGINVDYLGSEADSYSLEETPCVPIVKRYVDGSSIRRFEFIFCSRESYGAEALQNIANCGFYEHFADWIEEQNRIGELPELREGLTSQKIECTSTGYAMQVDEDTARYQIQLRLTYFKEVI